MSASWDYATDSVKKTILLNLALDDMDMVTDLFVFDELVSARINDGEFKFFPMPLVAGNYVDELPMEGVTFNSAGNVTHFENFTDIIVYGMYLHDDSYDLYALIANKSIKVSY